MLKLGLTDLARRKPLLKVSHWARTMAAAATFAVALAFDQEEAEQANQQDNKERSGTAAGATAMTYDFGSC